MQLKYCNHHAGEFYGDKDIIQERCPVCGDTETLPIEPPCPFCGEELKLLPALKEMGSTLLWCDSDSCRYFISREDAEEERLTNKEKSV